MPPQIFGPYTPEGAISNLIYYALQAQYLPHNEELSALIKQNHYHMEVEGRSRSVIQDCGCDREGRKTKLGS